VQLSKIKYLAILPVFIFLPAVAGSGQAPAAVADNPFTTATNQTQAAPPPPAPEVKPYEIPRFNGREGEDFQHIPPIKPAKQINGDAIFDMIVNCFPERHRWGNIKVKVQAGARWSESNRISALDESGLARHYVGIVGEMPLFSPDETYRQQEQERNRRQQAAQSVATLLKAVADKQRAWRTIGIAESVEARSQLRVQRGIVGAEEQIGYLKDVALAVSDLDAANAAIISARLALSGQCRDEVRAQVNNFLVRVTE
jgi:hypothetical protein